MMLCTVTFESPSCEAMLPQKFSAATTVNLPAWAAGLLLELPQPVMARIAAPKPVIIRMVLIRIGGYHTAYGDGTAGSRRPAHAEGCTRHSPPARGTHGALAGARRRDRAGA